MRGLVYCQHFGGIGHLMRALNLCKGLVEYFDIDFLQGGKNDISTVRSPRFRHFKLPPVCLDSDYTIQEGIKARLPVMQHLIGAEKYDFLLIEGFPFGKLTMMPEVLRLIQLAREANPHCLVFSSSKGFNREVKGRADPEKVEGYKVLDKVSMDFIKRYLDAVFVNSDPNLINLDEVFEVDDTVRDKIHYTGFIVNKEQLAPCAREKMVLVTCGSGSYGNNLIIHSLKLSILMPEYRFLVLTGPLYKKEQELQLYKKQLQLNNVKIIPFIEAFQQTLACSRLAITMAGSTLFDLYLTKTPALVYPGDGPVDQNLLARKFAELGLIINLNDQQLKSPYELRELALKAMHNPLPEVNIDIEGVAHIVRYLKNILK